MPGRAEMPRLWLGLAIPRHLQLRSDLVHKLLGQPALYNALVFFLFLLFLKQVFGVQDSLKYVFLDLPSIVGVNV